MIQWAGLPVDQLLQCVVGGATCGSAITVMQWAGLPVDQRLQ